MKKNIAIITGASSGLGKEFLRLLLRDRRLDEIWALARDKEKLQQLVKRYGKRVKIFSVDLSDKGKLRSFRRTLDNAGVNVLYLVNSAGYGKFCSYDNLNVGRSVNMIDLNISAVVAMGLMCIPYMKRGCHIINIASQAAFQPLPYLNIYSATKAFVRNYSRALNVELKSKGITVTAVCPGWMETPFFDRAEIGSAKTVRHFAGITTPNRVAAKALRDARKGKDISVYSTFTKLAHLAAKFLPQRVMMKIWLIQQRLY